MLNILFFITGAIMGSAANALIDRLPREESWFAGRSHCDSCGHVLEFVDLMPIVSYISLLPIFRTGNDKSNLISGSNKSNKFWQAGCRYCGETIPYRNFLLEIFMGIGFLLIFNFQFLTLNGLILSLILWVTTIITVMDAETKLVSEVMIGVWGLLVVLSQFTLAGFTIYDLRFTSNLMGLAAGAGLIGGLWAVSRGRAMGFGDVEIAAVSGWWLGWPNIVTALWTAFVSGGLIGGWKLITGKAGRKSEIAFGPYLTAGSWIGLIWGGVLIRWLFPY